jgi:LysR family transcriptional regulator, glycine cleavage system transcriptional activator
MTAPLPPLNTLRVFDAVARHMSFTKAAAELGMTQAAVSYQIKHLEDRLGQSMFRRMTRRLALTDAGARLAPAVSDALSRLRTAIDEISNRHAGILAVTAVTTFTTNWLVPRIGRFQQSHPELAVRIETSQRLMDLAREEFDVAIRGGRSTGGNWPGLKSIPLLSIDLAPMCAPGLLEQMGPADSPKDLLKFPLLAEFNADRPHPQGIDADWRNWLRAAGVDRDELPPVRSFFASQQMLASATMAGQGIALLTPAFFGADLDAGRLVPLSNVRLPEVERYFLVCLSSRYNEPKIRDFREWMQAELQAVQS